MLASRSSNWARVRRKQRWQQPSSERSWVVKPTKLTKPLTCLVNLNVAQRNPTTTFSSIQWINQDAFSVFHPPLCKEIRRDKKRQAVPPKCWPRAILMLNIERHTSKQTGVKVEAFCGFDPRNAFGLSAASTNLFGTHIHVHEATPGVSRVFIFTTTPFCPSVWLCVCSRLLLLKNREQKYLCFLYFLTQFEWRNK